MGRRKYICEKLMELQCNLHNLAIIIPQVRGATSSWEELGEEFNIIAAKIRKVLADDNAIKRG